MSGRVVWLTGVPASGKSTLARSLRDRLRARGEPVLWLDSDDLRRVLTPEPTYSDAERDAFYAAIAHLARLGADGGIIVLISATAHRRAYRDVLRGQVERFAEIWVRCEPPALEQRDAKGLYEAARRGKIRSLPGVGVPYEAPERPELIIDTTTLSPQDAAEAAWSWLEETP